MVVEVEVVVVVVEVVVMVVVRSGCSRQRNITPSELETVARDRTDWRSMCKSLVEEFEVRRIQ